MIPTDHPLTRSLSGQLSNNVTEELIIYIEPNFKQEHLLAFCAADTKFLCKWYIYIVYIL